MKLEITHHEGTPHEVELSGAEIVIGRDPSCDLVLNDNRCSRRHAVLEDGPDGLVIQDAGSSNGLRVNGRRLERSRLRPGDIVSIGDTTLTILSEAPETLVAPAMTETPRPGPPRRSVDSAPRATAPPPKIPQRPQRRVAPRRDAGPPVTLTALSVLWALSAPTWLVVGLLLAIRAEAGIVTGSVAVGAGLVLGAFGAVMATGLRAQAYWARYLQIATAGIGLFVCPFTFASVTILIYMLRPDVRAAFEAEDPGGGAGDAEPTFALSLLGMLALGLVVTGVAVFALSRP
jgi:pSer/pThr/pTyr-binding forkhead associated (FHA) protein